MRNGDAVHKNQKRREVYSAAKPPHHPIEPSEPFEPFEPVEPALSLSHVIKGQHAPRANPEV